jgi:hypothetical protein
MFAASKTDSVSGAGPDAQFNQVTMLLHGDGTNGAQNNTFVDSSTNAFSITRNGNTTQGSFSPYGSNWSNAFDGDASGDNLIAVSANTANAMGTGDWTAEAWIFLNVGGLTPFVFDTLPTSSGSATGLRMRLNASNQLQLWQYGSAVLTSTTTVAVGTWTHVALVKSSGTTTAYINGTASNTYSDSGNYICGTNRPMIGSDGFNNGSENTLNGYISNLRLVKGTAVYTGNFTPSTTPLTAISGTSLLACQSNRFKDNSSNNFTLTANGTPTVQRFNPFGTSTAYSTSVIGGSGYFDGTGDYLSLANNSNLDLGAGDFTLEVWIYRLNTSGAKIIWSQWNNNGDSASQLLTNGSSFIFRIGATQWSFGSFSANSWTHVAVSRSGSTVTMFVNGAVSSTQTNSTDVTTTSQTVLGANDLGATPANFFSGYMAGFRQVKGTAVYTSAFTPPTSPPTAITNTQLLTNFTNGAIFDNAMMTTLETVGNAQISTSVKKYGTGSIYLDGTGDWLTSKPSVNTAFGTGDFTVEFWINSTQTTRTDPIGINDDYNTTGWWGMVANIGSSGQLSWYENTNQRINATSTNWNNGSWNHIAVTRSGNSVRMFVNGTQVGSTYTTSFSYGINGTNIYGVNIGYLFTTEGNALNGYIDDLRITKGYARYTGTFTPPTSALPDTGPY